MSTTKQVKALLDDLRGKLDQDQAAYLEPILRKILDAAKPKIVTEVEYRSDPKDEAEIKSLRAQLLAKDEMIRQLRFQLAVQPPLLDHMSFDDIMKENGSTAEAWARSCDECMEVIRRKPSYLSRRKEIMKYFLATVNATLLHYLCVLEGLEGKLAHGELMVMVADSSNQWLSRLSDSLYDSRGIDVDLEFGFHRDECLRHDGRLHGE